MKHRLAWSKYGTRPWICMFTSACVIGLSSWWSVEAQEAAKTQRNLKVLPNTLTDQEIKIMMRKYVRETGLSCEACHAKYPNSDKLNYASDDNPMKEEARLMISMTGEIQRKYLWEEGSKTKNEKVSCGTCHRGLPEPQPFVGNPE